LVDELFRLFRHGKSLEEKKQKKMVKYLERKGIEVNGEKETRVHRCLRIKG
jgi:hypothetical protein